MLLITSENSKTFLTYDFKLKHNNKTNKEECCFQVKSKLEQKLTKFF